MALGETSWGWTSYLVLAAASGVLLVSVADALSRSGAGAAQPVFWVGILAIVLPIASRLASSEPARRERVVLVVTLGLALYLVKILLDPFGFAFADELVHAYNADEIRRTGSLFADNPILPATPRFPGLETATSAFASIAGIGTFGAGLAVVGAARLIIILGLYLLLEGITDSARVAGLGVVIYATTPNFLFFDAQYSYESLALPLAVLAIFALLRWERPLVGESRFAWAVVLVAAIAAVVVTHHISSYALAGGLVLVAALRSRFGPRRSNSGVWIFAGFAVLACCLWLLLIAINTVGYLSPVFGHGLSSIAKTIAGESPARHLFSSTTYQAPIWERIVGIGSVVLTALALPIGLSVGWRKFRRNPYALIAGGAAVGYVLVIPARLVPAAWEIANRSSEFLGIGLCLVLALAAVRLWTVAAARVAVVISIGFVFVGSVIAGWPPPLRVAQPYRIEAGSAAIDPQGVIAAEWSRVFLGRRNRIAADSSNARLQLALGDQISLTGSNPDINDVLQTRRLEPWAVRRLRKSGIRYVLVDRQKISFDAMRGIFFRGSSVSPGDLLPRSATDKFDHAGADRLFDSGDIVVFDIARLTGVGSSS